MNQEIKEEWCRRLESTEYIQGRTKLCRIFGDRKEWCCLGVLAEMAYEAGIVEKELISCGAWDEVCYDGKDISLLPRAVSVWAGFSDADINQCTPRCDPSLINKDFSLEEFMDYSLAFMNDSGRFTFAEIAAIIREQL